MKPRIFQIGDGRAKPFRVSYAEEGKRKTRHFATRLEALEFVDSLNVHDGASVLAVSTDERLVVAHLRAVAARSGLDLAEVSRRFVEFMDGEGFPAIMVPDAVGSFLAYCEKKNLRPKTCGQYWTYLDRFAATRKSRAVASVTRDEVLFFILGAFENDQSRDKVKVPLMAWLRWCERQGWCRGWDRPLKWERAKFDEKSISVMCPSVLRELLPLLPDSCRFGMALMAFAGVRPEEVVSSTGKSVLRWQDIRLTDRVIEIPGNVAKTRRRRVLHDIPENLVSWLETCDVSRRRGPVVTCSMRNFRKNRARALEGIGKGDAWAQDILRHSFASYGFHILGVERTIEFMGHTRPKIFFRHYKGAVSVGAAGEWFEVTPRRRCRP